MVAFQIIEATRADKRVIENLMQFYNYDFSEMVDLDLAESGRYELIDLGWRKPWRHFYLIKVNQRLAGFAIIDEAHPKRDEEVVTDMAEFFIMRGFRGQGIGERVANQLFNRFTGKWRVRQIEENTGALAFWRKVIDRYTDGKFTDSTWREGSYYGTVQYFETPAKSAVSGRPGEQK